MKLARSLAAPLALAAIFALTGCVSQEQYRTCERRNQIQQERINELESQIADAQLQAQQCRQQIELNAKKGGYWQQQLDALNQQLQAKNQLIQELTRKLGETALPVELSSALADWAAQVGPDVVTYDQNTGIVRFKSDLLFEKSQATVAANVVPKLESLAAILRSPAAEGFGALIVGHTDDIPIERAETKAIHPTNWHLSAHRAIAVEEILAKAGMPSTRMAVMGMGEFHPIAPNQAGKRGNPLNRRVEIYIVPADQLRQSTAGIL